MNLPNTLTLGRILMLPPLLIAVLYEAYGLAFVLFLFAAVSDALDGWLARRLDQVTPLGAYLDPLGDKLLTAVCYVALAAKGLLPAWLAVLVVSRDLLLAIGAVILYLTGHRTVACPSWLGKGSTFLQLGTIALVLLRWEHPGAPALAGLFWLTGVVTVLSGGHYVWYGAATLEPKPSVDDPLA